MPVSPQQSRLRLKDRRRRLMWVKVAAGAAVVLVAFVLLCYIARLPSITIASVSVSGTHLADADAVKRIAEEHLTGSYGFIVPHANAFFVPAASIESAIQEKFPAVAHVSVSEKSFTNLAVVVTERTPVALWCAGSAPEEVHTVMGECYLMDAGGFVYAPAGSETLVRYYGGMNGEPVGQTYLAGAFANLSKIVSGIAASVNRTPGMVAVDAETPDVSLTFAEGGVLRFERTGDAVSTVQNIASVFASQSFKDHPAFEYVDFRFGDKVYVKFK